MAENEGGDTCSDRHFVSGFYSESDLNAAAYQPVPILKLSFSLRSQPKQLAMKTPAARLSGRCALHCGTVERWGSYKLNNSTMCQIGIICGEVSKQWPFQQQILVR